MRETHLQDASSAEPGFLVSNLRTTMKGVSVLFFIGLSVNWASAEFLNHRAFPTYSLENMPKTEFSCRDKILGGYYADPDTQCQMFHICVKVAGVGVQDFRFLCPNGTAFDQDHQICAEWEDVDCDATTLYYSSDNFDLYRIGSGFESKAHKYGENEETFSLQRAETGDARINREHQSTSVNQRKEPQYQSYKPKPKQQTNSNNNNNNNNNNDRDIFKGSSSSNFFNNRNNGKEKDEDYDDNVNVNQDKDFETRRKVVRNKIRRPVQNNNRETPATEISNDNNSPTQRNDYQRNTQTNFNRNTQNDFSRTKQNNDYNKNTQTNDNNDNTANTKRPTRPTGFVNNFAGSSYIPTTAKPSSTTINSEQYTTALNNYRARHGQRQRPQQHTSDYNSPSTTYTVSTPAPFRQTQQYNTPPSRQNNGQYYTSTQAPSRETENYPQQKASTFAGNYDVPKIKQTTVAENYNSQYEVTKTKIPTTTQTKQTTNYQATSTFDNYPSNNPQYNAFEKKATTSQKQTENYPSTLNPKAKPFSVSNSFPTTFAPRTNAAYSQISQQTVNYNKQQSTIQNSQSTPKTTAFSQYTPTVPKITSTTPASSFPKDEKKFHSWLPVIDISPEQTVWNRNRLICSEHFKPDDLQIIGEKYYLIETAVPARKIIEKHHATPSTSDDSSLFRTYSPLFLLPTHSSQSHIASPTRKRKLTDEPSPSSKSQFVESLESDSSISRKRKRCKLEHSYLSSRFDETQYDDGSYNSKYDYDGERRDDEFLKGAHSQNIAASRNELARSTKQQQSTPRSIDDNPRPFSVSSNTPRANDTPKLNQNSKQYNRNPSQNYNANVNQNSNRDSNQSPNKESTQKPKPQNSPKPASQSKKTKDVSYDYAYYDTNIGSEPDYDINTDIRKTTITK